MPPLVLLKIDAAADKGAVVYDWLQDDEIIKEGEGIATDERSVCIWRRRKLA
jgi:hypothetical protein